MLDLLFYIWHKLFCALTQEDDELILPFVCVF